MLHIVKSPQALLELGAVVDEHDDVLLIEDAVYVANPQHKDFLKVKGMRVSVLIADLEARGVINRTSPSVALVDYNGFVSLTAKHETSLTWN
ncbi:sulfurtransferase complex subunit TusB [Vibrio japonicus]|uniref:Sulfurtransferase complex subunit TusB n=1 Tax=Vibrio japonicus TaxID=1824638 RepID=A0ABY5LIY3_9VIBR|nr:sulfurtransferase complex subunit TusB [Vibrio japonicus]UUM30859.1 sulfurtransferase complex subunit TusB [Vibrio japonicus]